MRIVSLLLSQQVADFILFFLGLTGTLSFFAREYLNIPYHSVLPVLVAFLASLAFSNRLKVLRAQKKHNISDRKNIIKFFLVIFLACILFRGFFLPVKGWDAYSLYDLRARVFKEGVLQSGLASFTKYDETNPLYYFSYPPMTSSIHAVIYSFGIKTPMFIYALFYISLVLYTYNIYKDLKMHYLLKVGFMIVSVGFPLILQQVSIAYTNLPMMAFQWGALFHLLKYKDFKKKSNLIASATLLGFSIWTRILEPTFLGFFIVTIIIVVTESAKVILKLTKLAFYCLIALLPRFIWTEYLSNSIGTIGKTAPSLLEVFMGLWKSFNVARMLEVLFFVFVSLIEIRIYLLLFLIVIIFWVYLSKKSNATSTSTILIVLVLSICSVMLSGILYLSSAFVWWDKIPGSFLRSNLILVPLISLCAAFLIHENGKKNL